MHQVHSWCLSSALVPSASTLCTHHCWVNQNVVSEDGLEIHSKSVLLIHTKTWMWVCPRGGWLTERELVWLSQGWELEPAPQHTILAPSSQISFLPGAKPPPQRVHKLSGLYFCKELCTSRWVQTLFIYCSRAFLAQVFYLLLFILPTPEMTGKPS